MKFLELKIPPLLLFAVFIAIMGSLAALTREMGINGSFRFVVGGASLLTGGYIAVSGVLGFKRAKTTVNPMKPEKATFLVNTGIYQYTRNPMYLGLLFCLLSWACFLDNFYSLVFVLIYPLYMTQFQIKPEERMLESIFGKEYETYKKEVRRWL